MEVEVVIARCVFCEQEIDATSKTTYRRVSGFIRKREAGGPNHIRLHVPVGEYACSPCVDLQAHGALRR